MVVYGDTHVEHVTTIGWCADASIQVLADEFPHNLEVQYVQPSAFIDIGACDSLVERRPGGATPRVHGVDLACSATPVRPAVEPFDWDTWGLLAGTA